MAEALSSPISPGPPQTDAAGGFPLVTGGPFFRVLLRLHLTGPSLEGVHRRIAAVALLSWAPLLVLSILDDTLWGSTIRLPFLHDIDAQVRFLVALPLILAADLIVHQRLQGAFGLFVSLGIVPRGARAAFDKAVAEALRWRDSAVGEMLLILLVYGVGIWLVWRHYLAIDTSSWYAVPGPGHLQLRPAGWWYFFVSVPLFQFILLRWYLRFLIVARLLWRLSRLRLVYSPMHPDRSGGIGFLSRVALAFSPLVLAQGALLAGSLANRIVFEGAALPSFVVQIVAVVGAMILIVLAPLLVFIPQLADAKREALGEYTRLARRYVDGFENKWLRGEAPAGEALVGSPDIQSLADLGTSFDALSSMRVVPITRETVVHLALMALLPLAPLILTVVPLEDLLKHLLKAGGLLS